jgi:hypothetical protein
MLRQGIKEYTNWPTIPQVKPPPLPPPSPAFPTAPSHACTEAEIRLTCSPTPLSNLMSRPVPSTAILHTLPEAHPQPALGEDGLLSARRCAGVHRGRVHRRVRHRDGDVPVGRARRAGRAHHGRVAQPCHGPVAQPCHGRVAQPCHGPVATPTHEPCHGRIAAPARALPAPPAEAAPPRPPRTRRAGAEFSGGRAGPAAGGRAGPLTLTGPLPG